ncbi:hypothetical protein JHW43_000332 [Diplocarpon mali]|nr:hypothetical protein JHW43_000332 [Diplocarpon mali]
MGEQQGDTTYSLGGETLAGEKGREGSAGSGSPATKPYQSASCRIARVPDGSDESRACTPARMILGSAALTLLFGYLGNASSMRDSRGPGPRERRRDMEISRGAPLAQARARHEIADPPPSTTGDRRSRSRRAGHLSPATRDILFPRPTADDKDLSAPPRAPGRVARTGCGPGRQGEENLSRQKRGESALCSLGICRLRGEARRVWRNGTCSAEQPRRRLATLAGTRGPSLGFEAAIHGPDGRTSERSERPSRRGRPARSDPGERRALGSLLDPPAPRYPGHLEPPEDRPIHGRENTSEGAPSAHGTSVDADHAPDGVIGILRPPLDSPDWCSEGPASKGTWARLSGSALEGYARGGGEERREEREPAHQSVERAGRGENHAPTPVAALVLPLPPVGGGGRKRREEEEKKKKEKKREEKEKEKPRKRNAMPCRARAGPHLPSRGPRRRPDSRPRGRLSLPSVSVPIPSRSGGAARASSSFRALRDGAPTSRTRLLLRRVGAADLGRGGGAEERRGEGGRGVTLSRSAGQLRRVLGCGDRGGAYVSSHEPIRTIRHNKAKAEAKAEAKSTSNSNSKPNPKPKPNPTRPFHLHPPPEPRHAHPTRPSRPGPDAALGIFSSI